MYTHTHTMHTCTHTQCIHAHTHNAYMHTQGGASINRTAGLLGKGDGGLTFSQLKYESGGGSLAIRHQTRRIDQPPPGYRPAYNTHTCIFTHTCTHAFTHTIHTLTDMHVCMCIASSCVYVCASTYTHTQKYCWTANTR